MLWCCQFDQSIHSLKQTNWEAFLCWWPNLFEGIKALSFDTRRRRMTSVTISHPTKSAVLDTWISPFPITLYIVLCQFYFFPHLRSRLFSKPKAVCRMRIPVPAPALPHRRLPPARPDRGTRSAKRNGKAKPAWARPPSCFPPAPRGENPNFIRNKWFCFPWGESRAIKAGRLRTDWNRNCSVVRLCFMYAMKMNPWQKEILQKMHETTSEGFQTEVIFFLCISIMFYSQDSERAGWYHTGPSAKLQVGFICPSQTNFWLWQWTPGCLCSKHSTLSELSVQRRSDSRVCSFEQNLQLTVEALNISSDKWFCVKVPLWKSPCLSGHRSHQKPSTAPRLSSGECLAFDLLFKVRTDKQDSVYSWLIISNAPVQRIARFYSHGIRNIHLWLFSLLKNLLRLGVTVVIALPRTLLYNYAKLFSGIVCLARQAAVGFFFCLLVPSRHFEVHRCVNVQTPGQPRQQWGAKP